MYATGRVRVNMERQGRYRRGRHHVSGGGCAAFPREGEEREGWLGPTTRFEPIYYISSLQVEFRLSKRKGKGRGEEQVCVLGGVKLPLEI